MTIRHLKVFLAVAETGKMSAAADQLFIAQPSVSQAIADIEKYYNVRLFERISRKLYITPAGEQLLDYARHIVALFDEMELEMKYSAEHTTLKIGGTVTVGTTILSELVSRFEAENPPVTLTVLVDNTPVIESMILKSDLDLGIVEGEVSSEDLIQIPAVEDEMVLICGPGHPFSGRKTVSLDELQGQYFVIREKGSRARSFFEKILDKEGVEIVEKWTCTNTEAIKNAVMGGQGLAVLSKRLVEREFEQGRLCILSIQGIRLLRNFTLIYHKNKFLSPPFKAFVQACEEYKD
ncbi:LysR family transcriptional regulator [Eubacterium sp. AM05-23]|uniref:LysR family transcriptional regulator n=1 Tax=Eubacterium maltosivorans TaxID=2041044 RepID=A0A4P9C9A4_EUBML|nr:MULTISPECIES: LysR family transcriptional regulator [Eubacterium]MBS6339691.1 LysR family transcriptional regulator [Eubacterium limosum]QCT72044.1 LysR family transcriptional regulator [Eubacterium maltosivorans]RHO61012.1 LysR family transcriptional regulator [Eubacterium sp. AM05-23]